VRGVGTNALPIYFFYLRIVFLATELKEDKQKRLRLEWGK